MSSRYTVHVAVALVLMLCACGCAQLLPAQPGTTPSVTRQQSGPVTVPTVPPPAGPPGMTWYLVSLRDGEASVPVIPNTTISAFFDGHGNVSGLAGCNRYTAPYSADRENLTIGTPVSTAMQCDSPPGATDQEARYLAVLQGARAYSVDGMLELKDDGGNVILTYSLSPQGTTVDAPLTGTTWRVSSFVDAAGTTRSPRGLTTITLIFGGDGNLYGNAGCNNHYGQYRTTEAGSIAIDEPQTTRIYCGIAGVMEMERAYLAVLPKMTRYSISGDSLRLSDAEGTEEIECSTRAP